VAAHAELLATAVSPVALQQTMGVLRRGGTCVLNGLPAQGISDLDF
jgi:hypothetical protein